MNPVADVLLLLVAIFVLFPVFEFLLKKPKER